MNQNQNRQWGQEPIPEDLEDMETGSAGNDNTPGPSPQYHEPSGYGPEPPENKSGPIPRAGQWSGLHRDNRTYTKGVWKNGADDPNQTTWRSSQGFGPFISPFQLAKGQLKSTVRRVVPALLLLFIVEYVAAYGIGFLINFALSPRIQLWQNGFQFPDNTYFGMSSGLYDILTSYLPVIIGEIAAVIYLRLMTQIPFKRLFGRPVIPESSGSGYTVPTSGADLTASRNMPRGLWILFAAVAGIGFSMIGQILALIELNFLSAIQFPFYSPDFSTADYTLLETVLMNLYVCILGPVMEELIFRGFLLRSLQKHGISFATIFTAILFTLYHMNLVQLCVPMLVGLYLAMLTIRTDSLIPAICCHILNNSLAMLTDYLAPADEIWSFVFLIVECAVFIGILAIFWIYYGRHFSAILRWRSPDMRLSSQVGAAVSSWPTVVFIVIYLLMLAASSLMTVFGG